MAALTPQLVSEIVRHRLGEMDASRSARVIFLIPEALKNTGRKIAANPNLRPLLMTDKATTTAALDAAGSLDLNALYASNNILLEYLDCGAMYHADNPYPLQPITPERAQLSQYLSNSYFYYYVQGNRLYVKDVTSGNIAFAVSYFPETLAELPVSEEVQSLFISKLLELVMMQDVAEDGSR